MLNIKISKFQYLNFQTALNTSVAEMDAVVSNIPVCITHSYRLFNYNKNRYIGITWKHSSIDLYNVKNTFVGIYKRRAQIFFVKHALIDLYVQGSILAPASRGSVDFT